MKQLIVNSIQCKHCKDIITSHSVHDYVTCKCGKVSTDGGLDYQHISFESKLDFINFAKYSDDPFEDIRKVFEWGSFGKSGKEKRHYIKLCDLSNFHLEAIINTQKHLSEFIKGLFLEEQKYRVTNNINIKD